MTESEKRITVATLAKFKDNYDELIQTIYRKIADSYTKNEVDQHISQSEAPEYVKAITQQEIDKWNSLNPGSQVSWSQNVTEGVKIASISIDGTPIDIYAPQGGSGAATDYNTLTSLPKINDVTLSGNKSAADLSLVSASEIGAAAKSNSYNDLDNKPSIPTEDTVSGWGFTKNAGTYEKPIGGIPASDLSSDIQSSLTKANTALQSFTETDPTVPTYVKNISEADITNWNNKSTFSGSYEDLSDKPTIPPAVSEDTVADWGFTKNTGTYSKPEGGIPKTDLATAVQTSLNNADTALQSFTEEDPTVPSHVKAITEEDIAKWNAGGGGGSVDAENYLLKGTLENLLAGMTWVNGYQNPVNGEMNSSGNDITSDYAYVKGAKTLQVKGLDSSYTNIFVHWWSEDKTYIGNNSVTSGLTNKINFNVNETATYARLSISKTGLQVNTMGTYELYLDNVLDSLKVDVDLSGNEDWLKTVNLCNGIFTKEILAGDGTTESRTDYICSDYIEIADPSKKVTVSCQEPITEWMRLGTFDENRNFITRQMIAGDQMPITFTVENNTKYVRISTQSTTTLHLQVENKDSASEYSNYSPSNVELFKQLYQIQHPEPTNLYNPSKAVKESSNVSLRLAVVPGASYKFSTPTYSWTAYYLYNASGSETARGGNTSSTKEVTFTAAANNTEVKLNFFPGDGVAVADVDFSNVFFYRTDNDLSGKQDTLVSGQNIKTINGQSILGAGNLVVSGGGGGGGDSLISTDISDILLTASTKHPIEIVLMGDSITEGYSASGIESAGSSHPVPTWANYNSWAGLLNKYITSNFPNVTVTNRGYSGQTSEYGATNVASWITNKNQIAIVQYGTNNRTSTANMNRLANDYTTILNRCKAVGAKMVPMCCIPATPYNEAIAGKYVATMADVHNTLATWATNNGYKLIDNYALMMEYLNNDTSNLEAMGLIYVGSNDNNLHLHPSDAGHAVMFEFIKNKLGIASAGGSGSGAYRHRITFFTMSGSTSYVNMTFYNNRPTPYNAGANTTTAEIDAFRNDIIAAGYTGYLQIGTLMCSGNIGSTQVCGMYVSGGKFNFISGGNFTVNFPTESGGSSASSSLRVWDTVERCG